jgi:hypothetical protein
MVEGIPSLQPKIGHSRLRRWARVRSAKVGKIALSSSEEAKAELVPAKFIFCS